MEIGHHDPYNLCPVWKGLKPSTVGLRKVEIDEMGPEYNNFEPQNNVFQIDSAYHDYMKSKILHEKQRGTYKRTEDVPKSILKFIIKNLYRPHAIYHFRQHKLNRDETALCNEYTNSYAIYDTDTFRLKDAPCFSVPYPDLIGKNGEKIKSIVIWDLFQYLAMQVQEDMVVHKFTDKGDYVTAISLCHASGWSAEGAIGQSFKEIHKDVPFIDDIIPNPHTIIKKMIASGNTMERIAAVNFKTTSELNMHPLDKEEWDKPFDLKKPELFIRFERQTVTGFADCNSLLFTIKPYIVDVKKLVAKEKKKIWAIFFENDPKLYAHKFINENRDNVMKYLELTLAGIQV